MIILTLISIALYFFSVFHMRNIVRLYEMCFPGKLVGKEVVTKDSRRIGICTGVMLDLDSKEAFILVANKNCLIKIQLDKIEAIREDGIEIISDIPMESVSMEEINSELAGLQEELKLLGKILYTVVDSYVVGRKRDSNKQFNIAKLFHLI